MLLAEGELADGPDLGILVGSVNFFTKCREPREIRTGLRFFFSSVSRVPALRAMISGAASGSCAMGEPHSEQKRRWTTFPEEPLEPE